MNARNFGLRTSNMERALVTAYQLKSGNGYETHANCKTACKEFSTLLKANGIRDLRKVERSHVQAYAEHLNKRYEQGEIKAGTPQDYLSKINVAMENARLDQECRVRGKTDAGLPSKSGIAEADRSTPQHNFDAAKQLVTERLSVQLDLQREIGLRFKESSLIDARAVLKHAEQTGKIKIDDGTKGGRPREIPVTSQAQINALKHAAEIQQGDRSLIPADLKWVQYQNQCYRDISKTDLHFHGNRHHYANERYHALTGVKSPVRAGVAHGAAHHQYIAQNLNISISEARILDKEARLQVSEELGHSRVSITNNYLG